MCYIVEVQVVAANYFADCENTSELPLSKLKSIKAKIETEFVTQGKFLTVDMSEEVLNNMIYSYPKYFSLDNEKDLIKFDNRYLASFYEDVFSTFNSQVNHKIKYNFLTALERILEEESKLLELAG